MGQLHEKTVVRFGTSKILSENLQCEVYHRPKYQSSFLISGHFHHRITPEIARTMQVHCTIRYRTSNLQKWRQSQAYTVMRSTFIQVLRVRSFFNSLYNTSCRTKGSYRMNSNLGANRSRLAITVCPVAKDRINTIMNLDLAMTAEIQRGTPFFHPIHVTTLK